MNLLLMHNYYKNIINIIINLIIQWFEIVVKTYITVGNFKS